MVFRIRSNPLLYPAGTSPGYDPTHLADRVGQQQTVLSAVSLNGSTFTNILNGKNGTVSGTVTAGINGILGPSPTFSGTSSVNFTIPSSTYISVTMAAIIYTASSSAGEQIVLASSSSNSGFRFGISGGNLHIVAGGVGDINPFPTIALATSTPYFIAVSLDTTTSNFVTKNLITGQVVAATNVSNTAVAGNGTMMIGNDFGNEGMKGSVAAIMMNASTTSPGRLSLTDLVAWANDPWAYWYSRNQLSLVGATQVIASAQLSQLLAMGVG